MNIIIGLGNPEKTYKGTRHNIGFEVINKLSYDYDIEINKAKFKAHIGEGIIAGKKVILVKPQTYMNLSGESVNEILKFYKLKAENIVVIYDDITLPLGTVKIRERGSAGGHNGIKNIIYHLETEEFLRIKVGIDAPRNCILTDYVLGKFKENEIEYMILGATKATDAIYGILKEGVSNAMNVFNRKDNK